MRRSRGAGPNGGWPLGEEPGHSYPLRGLSSPRWKNGGQRGEILVFCKLCAELGHVSIRYVRAESAAGKVHFANRRQIEKASFLAISHPGNWLFCASRQQDAEFAQLICFVGLILRWHANRGRNSREDHEGLQNLILHCLTSFGRLA
jgi:hypothetical protein